MTTVANASDRSAELVARLDSLSLGLAGRDFLLTWEQADDDIESVLLVAELLRLTRSARRPTRFFGSGLAISYFRDLSTRTRYSFASAADLLGLQVMTIDEKSIQVAHGETTRETAAMLAFLTEVVGIRDDIYLGHGHRFVADYAEALTEAVADGILERRPMVVNLQTDVDHPTQSMSDLGHLAEYFGGLEGLRGKRIAVTWAHSPSYGKPLSVAQGLVGLLSRFGADLVLAHPPGYELLPDVLEVSRRQAEASGGRLEITDSMEEAFRGARVVYPKSWAPMGVLRERAALLEAGSQPAALADLERRCLAQNAQHVDWECNAERMALTEGGNALYMHCLPADISGVSCPNGEVTDEVFSRYRTQTYAEAGWKPYVVAAMILLGKCDDPVGFFKEHWAGAR